MLDKVMRLMHNHVLVVFTGLEVVRNMYALNDMPANLFMGFGYNPRLFSAGERLDLFEFFAWMKRLQGAYVQQWTIWDASGYSIVNTTPKKKIQALNDKYTGENVLDVLIQEQERAKRAEIKINCDLRSRYLQRLITITGINGVYLDSRQIFREDKQYSILLDVALEYVQKLKVDNPLLLQRIIPLSDNPARELYLPLEITEALYLQEKYGVEGKYGPKTEQFFDACILGMQEQRKVPYSAVWSAIGPRRVGYLDDEKVLWTSSPNWLIKELLQRDQNYFQFIQSYLQPFQQKEERSLECVLRLRNLLKLTEAF